MADTFEINFSFSKNDDVLETFIRIGLAKAEETMLKVTAIFNFKAHPWIIVS
jgi:hypothetical protein